MRNTWKKAAAFAMALALVAGAAPAMNYNGGLLGRSGIVAHAAAYTITLPNAENGSVSATVGESIATSADSGATVTLTANPANGYKLKSISGTYKGNPHEDKSLNGTKSITGTYFNYTATDAAGQGWKLANNSSITISSSSKTITKVEFNISQRGNSFSLNNVNCSAGTKSLSGNTLSLSSVNSKSLTLSQSVNNAGYVRFNSVKVYYDGTAVDETLKISGTGTSNVYTFTMPESNVTLSAEFEEDNTAVSGVQLNKTETNLTVGGNETLTATVSPDGATDKTVTWSSSNTDVATVDANGKVSAVGAGSATITATATNGTEDTSDDKTATCAVIVNSASSFSNASVTLADDLALNFYVDGIADDTAAAEYTVNFTGACVDESSALTYNAAVGKYYATTHVYAKDIDKDITATLCKGSDTVDTIEDYSITQYLSSDAFSGADEKTSALITATKDFGNASSEYFYGTGSSYSDGFASYAPDTSAYAATFDSDAAKLSLVLDSKTAARLYVKDDTTGTESTISSTKADYPSYHGVAGLLPQNLADEQTINVGGTDYTFSALTWCNRVLTNESASQKNINMAKAIMAYYEAAKNYSSVDVSSVTITNAPTEDIEVGETGTLTATVSPDNATNKTVTWAVTEGEDVLSINAATGAYTALKAGTAKVTATAGGKSVTCIVTVKAAVTLAGVTLTDGMIVEPHCNVKGEDNWVQFKYVADDNKFVPNFNSYNDAYSKSGGDLMQQLADQWAFSTLEMHENPNGNFYLTQTGNTVHLRADDGIDMLVIDLQLDFDNMTYTQLYKQWYNTVSGSFTSIKIGDTTITASQMTAN